MMIKCLEAGDVEAADKIAQFLRDDGPWPPSLKDTRTYVFWGARVWVAFEKGVPVSILMASLGKRKKNIWEPYVNWYSAYTAPHLRREGYATSLYNVMEKAALEAGCRRIKSLAGSSAGLGLHASLGHLVWGLNDQNEAHIDSPLPGHAGLYKGKTPPQALAAQPFTKAELHAIIKKGLRYDAEKI